MTQYNGHSEDCLCVACMMADMDAHVAAQGGTIHKVERTEAETTGNRLAGQGAGYGTVRRISDAQVRFISKLIAERDLTTLQLLPGQFVDAARIPTMGVKGGSALIEKLLALPMKAGAPVGPKMASEKQAAFLTKLLAERVTSNMAKAEEIVPEKCTAKEASMLIEFLLGQAKKSVAAAAKPEIEEGMYVLGERIIKVQVAKQGSGNLYAKELIDGSFEYVAGLIRKMKDARRMTLDEAKAYGKLYGVCCVCGRDLTDEASIAAGIGPICASKF